MTSEYPMDSGQMSPAVYDPLTAGDNIRPFAPPPSQWNYAGDLHHHQQPISYSSNPTSNCYDYQYNSIQSLDGAAMSADPSYPYTGEGFATAEVGGAIDGVYCCGGEDPMAIAAKEAIRQYGMHPFGYASGLGNHIVHLAQDSFSRRSVPSSAAGIIIVGQTNAAANVN